MSLFKLKGSNSNLCKENNLFWSVQSKTFKPQRNYWSEESKGYGQPSG